MARKRRRQRPDPRLARMMPADPGWRWRTLPVWLALTGGFIIGWYVAAFGSDSFPTGWSYWVHFIVLTGFSLGLSRIVRWRTERWVARRRAQESPPPTRDARRAHLTPRPPSLQGKGETE